MFRNKGDPLDVVIDKNNSHLLKDTKDKIVFITHGWTFTADSKWVIELKDAFLKTYPQSAVITVDWRVPAKQEYPISAINVYDIGNFIGDLILDLVDNHNVDISKFLLVGHSLGGQTSGFAGKRVQQAGKKLPRIFALDPAGPLFEERPTSKRLNATDAEIVEVLHTDGDYFGMHTPSGTIDFFPNGGIEQLGCPRLIFDEKFESPLSTVGCDHDRSCFYFIEAVLNPTSFEAEECTEWTIFHKVCNRDNKVYLGDLTTKKTGKFYMETNNKAPFSKSLQLSKASFGIFDRIANLFKKPGDTVKNKN